MTASFWKFISDLDDRETKRYLEMFYILKMRDLVSKIPEVGREEPEALAAGDGVKVGFGSC